MSRKVEGVTLAIAKERFFTELNPIYSALYLLRELSVESALKSLQKFNFKKIGLDPIDALNLMDSEAGSKRVISAIDANIAKLSKEFSRRVESSTIVELGDVVIGTSLAAVQAAPMASRGYLTFISADRRLGGPWRSRFYLANSSMAIIKNDVFAFFKTLRSSIPFQNQGTTPVAPSGYLFYANLEGVNKDPICVTCIDGSQRAYPWGIDMGKCIAFNIFSIGTNFLMETEVDFTSVRKFSNTDSRVYFEAKLSDGTIGRFICKTLVVASGPGVESVNYSVEGTTELFARSVESRIKGNRILIEAGESPKQIELPKLLNLTTIEMLLGHWVEDLGSDPKMYPFNALFANIEKTLTFVGGGDSSRVALEFVLGKFHRSAYPDEIYNLITSPEFRNKIKIRGVNFSALAENGYDDTNERVRYDERVAPLLKLMDVKGIMANVKKLLFNEAGEPILELSNGDQVFEKGYTFVSTGLSKVDLPEMFRNSGFVKTILKLFTSTGNFLKSSLETDVRYSDGIVDLGTIYEDRTDFSEIVRIIFLGSCDRIVPTGPIKDLLGLIKIKENTIAAWYRTLIAQLTLTYFVKNGFERIRPIIPKSIFNKNFLEENYNTPFKINEIIPRNPYFRYENTFSELPIEKKLFEYEIPDTTFINKFEEKEAIINFIKQEEFSELNYGLDDTYGSTVQSIREPEIGIYSRGDFVTSLQLMVGVLFAKLASTFKR